MKVIVFFSGDAHVGCTTISGAVARELAAKGNRTLLIHASGKVSSSYITKDLCHSIDDIRASIISGKLNTEELHQVSELDGELEIIGDVRNTYTSKYFPIDTFEKIKEIAGDYSYIVVDAGNRMELAMNISALNIADERYFVISQNPSCISRFREMDDYILRQIQCNFEIILNRFSKDFALYRRSEVEDLINRKVNYVIPELEYGKFAEIEKKNVLFTKGGKRALNEITNGLLQEHPTGKARGLFSRGLLGEGKKR